MTSSGKFSGSTQVSKKEFVTTTNKALKTSYVVNGGTEKITLLDVAKIFKDYNSKEYSQEIKNKYKKQGGADGIHYPLHLLAFRNTPT